MGGALSTYCTTLRLTLFILADLSWRALRLFLLFLGTWLLLALYEASHREPVLGPWGIVQTIPSLAGIALGPSALTALVAAVSSSFAAWSKEGELTAASASGIGPLRWVLPVALLGLVGSGWLMVQQLDVAPAANVARRAQFKLLLREPAACVRLLSSDPGLVGDVWLELKPTEGGGFEDFWALSGGSEPAVWRAKSGRLVVPPDRNELDLELEDVRHWEPRGSAELLRTDADRVTIGWPAATLSPHPGHSDKALIRTSSAAQLRAWSNQTDDRALRGRIRAALADRFGFGLSVLPLMLAAIAVGLFTGRWGAWAGSVGGIVLASLVYFPMHRLGLKWVASGAPVWAIALPSLALLYAALPALRRWRTS